MLSEKKNLINFFTARCDYHVISPYNIHIIIQQTGNKNDKMYQVM